MEDFFIYSGSIHIHSILSDGSASIEEISQIASDLGMDYIIIADHNTLAGKDRGYEKRIGKTHVLIGYELNDPDDENYNHYLAFGLDHILPLDLKPAEFVAKVKENGGVGFIAHPDERREGLIKDFPGNPWIDWTIDDFDGIEIWNQMSEWMERLNIFNLLWMTISPRKGIYKPFDITLKRWDTFNLKRKIAGIGGIDVHAMKIKIGPFVKTFFPYKVQFKSIRTNIILRERLSDDFEVAKWQIYNALKNANSYIYNYRWGDITSLVFYASNENEIFIPGDETFLAENMYLNIVLPEKLFIKIVKNGNIIFKDKVQEYKLKIMQEGNYRLEVYKKKHGWIFTNNIYVR